MNSARGAAPALAVALALAACSPLDRSVDELTPPSSAPPALRAACETTVHRCSRCHPLDRVLELPADRVRPTVHRMRFLPGSGISPDDEAAIALCLTSHASGATP